MSDELMERAKRIQLGAKRALIKRRDHLLSVLERTKTANIHDKNGRILGLKSYSYLTEEDNWGEFLKLRASCERAEGFLYQVAHGYDTVDLSNLKDYPVKKGGVPK
jgi:hypothetical protein